jgi:hypothetical protein
MTFQEAETLALQTLKQVMEEAITSKNIEVRLPAKSNRAEPHR